MDQTAFTKLLEEYFPDIYRLHKLGENEAHLWEALQTILANNTNQVTGDLVIRYSNGHIYEINQTVKIIANRAARPGYTKAQAEDARAYQQGKRGA